MNIDLSFLDNNAIIAMVAFVFLYLTYYFSSDFGFVQHWNKQLSNQTGSNEKSIYLRRTIGFLLLGLIPIVIILLFFDRPLTDYGIDFPKGTYAWLWFLAPTLVFVLGSVFRYGKSIDLSYYPEVRRTTWDRKGIWINSGFWIVYLLGYEFAIRGMLFFSTLYEFGLWPAIFINSVIYSLIHIFKGSKEAYGAFFLGILFCLITYYTNSIWIAVILHIILAIANDIKAIKETANQAVTK